MICRRECRVSCRWECFAAFGEEGGWCGYVDSDKVGLSSWIGFMISLLVVDIVVLIVWRKHMLIGEDFYEI